MVALALFAVILGFFALKLYDLQIIETGGSTNNQATFTTLTRVKAMRGHILDKNGNPMVSNRASYDLIINHYVLLTANGTNDNLLRLVKRCEEAGIEYTEHFPISQERPFAYTLDQQNPIWQDRFQVFLNIWRAWTRISPRRCWWKSSGIGIKSPQNGPMTRPER